jgi:N6-adenosine-specific RNA methylase IME4
MDTDEWLRGQAGHCLFGVRREPVLLSGPHGTVLEAARREQSRKRDEFYVMLKTTR